MSRMAHNQVERDNTGDQGKDGTENQGEFVEGDATIP